MVSFLEGIFKLGGGGGGGGVKEEGGGVNGTRMETNLRKRESELRRNQVDFETVVFYIGC